MTGRLLGGPRRPAVAGRPAADGANGRPRLPGRLLLLAAIAGTGLPLIALYGVGLVSPVSLVAIPTTLFLTVYLGSMLAATRVLRGHGPARLAAMPATAATAAMLAYCGWALAVPVAIITVVTVTGSIRRSR
jgi:amino acid efflux transporter